jgi:Short C-terminal domain
VTTAAVSARPDRLRRPVVLALVVLATVAALGSVLAIWVQRQVLDTDVYVRTSSSLLADPGVRTAVANYTVDELYRRVDVEAELEDVLPNDADRYSKAAAAALRPLAYQVVDQALRTSLFAGLWEHANREAHTQFVAVVKGGNDSVSTDGGVVRLGLRPILIEASKRVGFGENLAARIPIDSGQVEVLRSDELGTMQNAVRLLSGVSNFLPFLALGLYGLALWLARGRRREALRNTGISLIAGGVLLLLVVGALRSIVLGRVVTEPEARGAAGAVWAIVVNPLNGALWAAVALGGVLVLGAVLAGPGRQATSVRRSLAPYLAGRGFAIGAGTALVLLLLLAGAIDSFVRFAWLTIFIALAAFGVEALRRQTLHEFPNAERPPMADWLRERLRVAGGRARSAVEARTADVVQTAPGGRPDGAGPGVAADTPPVAAAASAAPSAGAFDDLDRLERLAEMHERGVLTDEEFATMKSRLVNP